MVLHSNRISLLAASLNSDLFFSPMHDHSSGTSLSWCDVKQLELPSLTCKSLSPDARQLLVAALLTNVLLLCLLPTSTN